MTEVEAPPGIYSIVACLGQTGSWHGRACSPPVQLTVEERPQSLAPDRQSIVDRRGGRFARIAGDAPGLEQAGRKLIAAAAGDVEGQMYLGEARYLQSRWTDALAEFTTARTGFRRSYPDTAEPPSFLDARISRTPIDWRPGRSCKRLALAPRLVPWRRAAWLDVVVEKSRASQQSDASRSRSTDSSSLTFRSQR